MSIEHILVLSTGHITLADNYKLTVVSNTRPLHTDYDAMCDLNKALMKYGSLRPDDSPLSVTSRPHGFLIYVPSDSDDFDDVITDMQKPPFRFSTGLRRCMELAHHYKCDYLLLDRDGDAEKGLKLYEW